VPTRGSGGNRDPAFFEALKLRKGGMTQAEIGVNLGYRQDTISDWFTKYGAEKIFVKRECLYCGKVFNGKDRRSKYCTQSCAWKATYLRNHPQTQRMRFNPELRAKALELYWGGLEGRLISEHLNIAEGTVHCWIHDFGHLRKRRRDAEVMKLMPVTARLECAKSPDEWQRILRENAPDGENSSIIMVCGTSHGCGGASNLAGMVFDLLKRDPCDGNTYAFCSYGGERVTAFYWHNGAFRTLKMPKARGGYVWPKASVGTYIELRENEFEYLLSLSKKRGAKHYFA
jgi:transposase-like protein